MQLGYYAYGMVDHYLPDAVRLLRDIGYQLVVLPLGARLHPRSMSVSQSDAIVAELQTMRTGQPVRLVLDLTTPFAVSPYKPHGLDLLTHSDDAWPQDREAFAWSIDLASRLGGEPMIVRTGSFGPQHSIEETLERLSQRIEQLLPRLDALDVDIAIQPSDDHFVHNVAGFVRLLQWIDSPRLRLAVDTATMYRQIEFPLYSILAPVAERLSYVTFRDPSLKAPVGDWIGHGQVSCDAVVECLKELEFTGALLVHSWPADHQALDTAHSAWKRLS